MEGKLFNQQLGISLVVVALTLFQGCGEADNEPKPYSIGDYAYGGVIYHILQPGDKGYDSKVQHGLVVNIFDQTAEWGCYGSILSGADDLSIGSGKQNTLDILVGCKTPGIAARLCHDLSINGFSDWYLPSANELYIIFSSKAMINQVAISNGGDDFNGYYWSSTENNWNSFPESMEQWAGVVDFNHVRPPSDGDFWNSLLAASTSVGPFTFAPKDRLYNVRAVRSF